MQNAEFKMQNAKCKMQMRASVWRVTVVDRHVMLQGVRRRPAAVLDRTFRERLEIQNAGIAPPARLLLLNGKEGTRLVVAFGVNETGKPLPRLLHFLNGGNALAITERELVPQRASGRHLVVPRHVLQAQDVVIGDGYQVREPA